MDKLSWFLLIEAVFRVHNCVNSLRIGVPICKAISLIIYRLQYEGLSDLTIPRINVEAKRLVKNKLCTGICCSLLIESIQLSIGLLLYSLRELELTNKNFYIHVRVTRTTSCTGYSVEGNYTKLLYYVLEEHTLFCISLHGNSNSLNHLRLHVDVTNSER